jgi:hypothetical protein
MQRYEALTARLAGLAAQVSPGGGGGVGIPPKVAAGLNTLIDWAKYVGYGACIIGIIAAAVTMAIAHQRGSIGEHAGRVVTAIGAVIIIGAAVSLVAALAS